MYQHFSQPSPTIGNRLKSKSFNQQNKLLYILLFVFETNKPINISAANILHKKRFPTSKTYPKTPLKVPLYLWFQHAPIAVWIYPANKSNLNYNILQTTRIYSANKNYYSNLSNSSTGGKSFLSLSSISADVL